jgi:hypothetical protein
MSQPLAEELANILSAVVTQIRGLSDDEVRALAAGDAEFRFVARKPKPTRPAAAPPVSTVDTNADPDGVKAALRGCGSEGEALAYLRELKLSLPAAKALANGLGLRLPARPSVTSIQAEIVRVFVGGRLNTATVQGL